MLVLKMMSDEDKADSNPSKCFELLCCDNVEFLRKDRDDLIKRLEIRDGQLDEQTVLMANQNDLLKKQQFEIESLKEKINVLTSLATGQEHIEALLQEIKNHNAIVENRYHEYMGRLTTMIESQQRIEQKVINSK